MIHRWLTARHLDAPSGTDARAQGRRAGRRTTSGARSSAGSSRSATRCRASRRCSGIYHVSRPTLREALRILETEGLVTIKRGAQGGQVHLPDVAVAARHVALQLQVRRTTMEDLFAARRVLEPGAVRMLAERASPDVVAALRAQLDVEAALLDSPDAYATAATRFHELLVELTGNNTLTILSGLLCAIVERHHHETFARAGGFELDYTHEASEHHVHVVDLIEQGEAEDAEAFWR